MGSIYIDNDGNIYNIVEERAQVSQEPLDSFDRVNADDSAETRF